MSLVPHGERIKENLPQDAFASSKQEGRANAPSNTTQPMRICTEGSMFAETRVRASNVMFDVPIDRSRLSPTTFDLDRPLHRWCGNFVTRTVVASVFLCQVSCVFPIVEPHHAAQDSANSRLKDAVVRGRCFKGALKWTNVVAPVSQPDIIAAISLSELMLYGNLFRALETQTKEHPCCQDPCCVLLVVAQNSAGITLFAYAAALLE